MFAVYAKEANYNDPLASVIVGERPEPIMPEGRVRVTMPVSTATTSSRYWVLPRRRSRSPSDDPGK
jgi:hypothetical protein